MNIGILGRGYYRKKSKEQVAKEEEKEATERVTDAHFPTFKVF